MAITQLNTADFDYAMMLNVINKAYKGKADITITEYSTSAAPVVKVGSVFEDNGAIFLIETADYDPVATYAGLTNSTTFYLYYDVSRNSIALPYYYHSVYVGAQVRFINPSGDHKVETVPGTRTGLLFYGWNQDSFVTDIKGVIITEGAFNSLAIQQSLDSLYGGIINNPWKCIAASGSGGTKHQLEKAKELKDNKYKIVIAPDNDDAGFHMFKKFVKNEAATHYAFTGTDKADWNDMLIRLGKEKFADFFLKSIKKVGK